MSAEATPMSAAIKSEVCRILWEEWDPIGVRAIGGPDDEYDAYANGIVDAILSGRDATALFRHLTQLRTQAMGLSPSHPEVDRHVAKRLAALRNNRQK